MLFCLIKIASKNLMRHKRRTILTLLILVLGSSGMILVGGFFDNIMEGLREQFIHGQTGHLQVNVAGYHENGVSAPFDYLMSGVPATTKLMEATPHVVLTVPRLKFGGMVSNENTSVAVVVLGVDPAKEKKMGEFKYRDAKQPSINIVAGEDLSPAGSYDAVLGRGLLKALKLKVGDSFTLITTRQAGAIDGVQLTVRGAFETIFKEMDDRAMKINLKTAQTLLGADGKVHTLLAVLDDTGNTDSVRDALDNRLREAPAKLEILTWLQLGDFYRLSKDLFGKINRTIQLIIGIVFFFSIANTINMSLFERIREFGMMMAMGNSRTVIFSVIFLEAVVLGLFGALLGVGIGSGIGLIVSAVGIEMPPPPMGSNGYFAMISLSPALLVQVFVVSFASTLLSSLVPAYRAAHFKIVEALGYV